MKRPNWDLMRIFQIIHKNSFQQILIIEMSSIWSPLLLNIVFEFWVALATCQDTQNKNNENNRNDHILRTARFITRLINSQI